jgi:GNAT superfamily N-acetyltransferase
MGAREVSDAHPAENHERDQVVTALCRAFFDDRIYRWMVPDDDQRRRSAEIFYSRFVGACWQHGHVYSAGAGAGAALWVPPAADLVGAQEADAFVQDLLDSAGDDACAARMAAMFEVLDEHHPTETHWYLAFMGVAPGSQGQGIGSALLNAVLAGADRAGMPAYLEASCPENRRLYERHGFVQTRELAAHDSPSVYPMWREPRDR